jgi:tetratricopeptide (TPR) repeat protein
MVEFIFFDNTLEGWKRKLPVILGLVILISLAFAWFAGAFKGDLSGLWQRMDRLTRETADVGRWQYLCTQFTVILLYLKLIVFPKGLNIDHGYPMKNGFFEGITPIAFVIILGVIILSLVYSKKYKILSFGVLWFFIALSVESSILPIRDAMFEHRVYLAFPGISMFAAFMIYALFSKSKLTAISIICFAIICFGSTSFYRAMARENKLSIWKDSVQKAPHNKRAWQNYSTALNNYGNELSDKGQNQLSVQFYQEAIKANPSDPKPYCNMGKLYAQNKQFEKAEELLLKSIETDPEFAEAYNNLAIVYMSKKQYEKGIKYFKNSLAYDPYAYLTHYNLGMAYMKTNKPDQALEHLLRAIKMHSDIRPLAYYTTAAAWAMKGDPEKAAIWIKRAREKGFDKSIEFVKKDPRFKKCRKEILKILPEG